LDEFDVKIRGLRKVAAVAAVTAIESTTL